MAAVNLASVPAARDVRTKIDSNFDQEDVLGGPGLAQVTAELHSSILQGAALGQQTK